MAERLIKNLPNGNRVVFDSGKFDNYCVYVCENGRRVPPLDETYFTELKNISRHYPNGKVYQDFVQVYNQTNKNINPQTLDLIEEISLSYQQHHQEDIEKWMVVIYAGMVAEENKQFAVLKKRIKRLGMHQVLVDGLHPGTAANFSRGKKWRELDAIMKTKGF